MQDALKKKEDNIQKRIRPEKEVSMNSFKKLTKELAGEVDNDFAKLGPKDQRKRKSISRKGKWRIIYEQKLISLTYLPIWM